MKEGEREMRSRGLCERKSFRDKDRGRKLPESCPRKCRISTVWWENVLLGETHFSSFLTNIFFTFSFSDTERAEFLNCFLYF